MFQYLKFLVWVKIYNIIIWPQIRIPLRCDIREETGCRWAWPHQGGEGEGWVISSRGPPGLQVQSAPLTLHFLLHWGLHISIHLHLEEQEQEMGGHRASCR